MLLVYHFENSMADIFVLSEVKRSKSRRISIRLVHLGIGNNAAKQLLVIHALSGCDTASVLYDQGKTTIFRKNSSVCKQCLSNGHN